MQDEDADGIDVSKKPTSPQAGRCTHDLSAVVKVLKARVEAAKTRLGINNQPVKKRGGEDE